MQSVVIPVEVRVQLAQLVPTLDLHWQDVLAQIWPQLNMDQMELVQQQILIPKGIVWNSANHRFEHEPPLNFAKLLKVLNDEQMRENALYLAEQLEQLRTFNDCYQIAQLLEQSLSFIRDIDVEEDFELQHEKILLHHHFILNAAQIIHAINIEVPQDDRQLSKRQVKSFIVEIFLKQQLLGQAFQATVRQDAAVLKHPIFKYYLKREQKAAHFGLLQSAEFVFVLAPNFAEASAFGITYFLKSESHDQSMFNGLVVDLKTTLENDYIEQIKAQVLQLSRMQGFISLEVQSMVEQLQQVVDTQLIPLLYTLEHTEHASQVLNQFEHILKSEILEPLQHSVKFQLTDSVQFDFVYFKMLGLCQNLIAEFNALQLQFFAIEHIELNHLKQKLQAWLLLLKKRRYEIFTPHNEDEWEKFHALSQAPRLELANLLRQILSEYQQLNTENTLNDLVAPTASHVGFSKRMTKSGEYESNALALTKAKQQLKRNAFMQVLSVFKQHAAYIVTLDFELMDENIKAEPEYRRFALAQGDNGLDKLPQLVEFSTRYFDFDIEQFAHNFEN
ncbi:hypothetical protein B9T33_02870 [Acinetobacter sp. ANC 5054]|uniref:hypothetical protein n=1 Tax=Acinetobacter sp. ANC 5054 TaxID=1977877 RepID=UPI000A34384F|nr:hypothetical protein [Acinetobacter sp. ANC 5054]OTG83366.1 hypothetical protein B9T33_02870 [Acinetobacter sp. ANC 5054]